MIAALILLILFRLFTFGFFSTCNKAIITEVVEKEIEEPYNAHLELVYGLLVSVHLCFLPSSTLASLHATLLLDALDLFIAFVLVAFLPKEEPQFQEKHRLTRKDIFSDIKEGLDYIWHQKEIFFLVGGFRR